MEKDSARGVLLGLGCGDALGRPVEFNSAKQIERQHGQVTEMLGGGTHNKEAGTITDDSELALCIAQSLVASDGFDPEDVSQRFVAWYDSNPFDVGMMTSSTLRRLKQGEDWQSVGERVWEQRPEGQNAGNGSVMRCAPYAIAFAKDPSRLGEISRTSSGITHYDPRCRYGCEILNRTIAGLLTDQNRPLESALDHVEPEAPTELTDALRGIPDSIDPGALESSGYVVSTLQSGLYHGLTASTAREGIVGAVNMGDDADTVGAVTGAVVGARFGESGLPDSWIRTLTVDETGRNLPNWWPDSRSAPDRLRELAECLTDIGE